MVLAMIALKYIVWLLAFTMFMMLLYTHLSITAMQQLPGTVVDHIARIGSKRRTVYALSVEYLDHNGAKCLIESKSSSSSAVKDIGESVIVLKPYGSITQPKLLLFYDLFYTYWFVLCFAVGIGVCLVGQDVMEWLYL